MTTVSSHPLPSVEYAQRSDPGRDPEKQINEDVAAHKGTRFGHLCVVCDGMGGHAGGREAATLALETMGEVFENAPEQALARDVLKTAIEEANRRVFAMGPMTPGAGRPGSTTVAVLLHARGVEIAHVGDSRGYLIHQGQIVQITKDHSMVQQMVDAGVLTSEQAAVHPDANKITRALGMGTEVEVELRPNALPHVAGDTFVLCSDGLSDLVGPADILQIAGSAPAAQAVGQLVDLANARGGHDNITVAILRARESAVGSSRELLPTVAQTTIAETPAMPDVVEVRPIVPTLSQTHPPSPSSVATRKNPSRAILFAGLALALVGVAALGVAVYIHLHPTKRAQAAMVDPIFTAAPPSASVFLVPVEAGVPDDPDAVAPPTAADPSSQPALKPLEIPSSRRGGRPRPRPPLPAP